MEESQSTKLLGYLDDMAGLITRCKAIVLREVKRYQEEEGGHGKFLINDKEMSAYHLIAIMYALDCAPEELERTLMGSDTNKEHRSKILFAKILFGFQLLGIPNDEVRAEARE